MSLKSATSLGFFIKNAALYVDSEGMESECANVYFKVGYGGESGSLHLAGGTYSSAGTIVEVEGGECLIDGKATLLDTRTSAALDNLQPACYVLSGTLAVTNATINSSCVYAIGTPTSTSQTVTPVGATACLRIGNDAVVKGWVPLVLGVRTVVDLDISGRCQFFNMSQYPAIVAEQDLVLSSGQKGVSGGLFYCAGRPDVKFLAAGYSWEGFTDESGSGWRPKGDTPGGELPSGYMAVDYIVAPRDSYIDTGYNPSQNSRVMMDVTVQGAGEYWFGCWDEDYNKGAFAFGNDGTGIYAGYGNQGGTFESVVAAGRHIVELDGNEVKVDGIGCHSFTNESFALTNNLYFFAQNRKGKVGVAGSQNTIICQECTISENGTLKRDFLPCVRTADGAVGLFDTVEKQFYENRGNDTFGVPDGTFYTVTVGNLSNMTAAYTFGDGIRTNAVDGTTFGVPRGAPDVKVIFTADPGYFFADGVLTAEVLVGRVDADCTVTAPEVQMSEIETFGPGWYVTVTDGVYVDTLFRPDSNTRVEMDVDVGDAQEYWFGCWTNNWDNGAFALGNDVNNEVYCGYGSGRTTCGGISGLIPPGRVTVALEKGVVYTNDVVWSAAHADSNTVFALNYNLYLFAQNRKGTTYPGWEQDRIICYGCRIWTNDVNGAAVPVRNFVPARTKDDQQVVGLYDMVSGEFFAPCGGSLTLGHEKPREMDSIGVCSWSWHEPMTNIIRRMEANGFKGIQLALSPWVWEGEGSAAQKETFGDQEGEEVFNLISNKFAKGELDIHATMICFSNEDYTTEHTISNTCGFYYGLAPSATEEQKELADLTWEIRSNQFAKAVERTRMLGVRNITAHIGLSEYDDANMSRLYWACKTCRENGCKLLVETGMYSAERTVAALKRFTELHPDAEIGLNFDTANQVLYGADNPTNAYAVMKGWIEQVHIKDCVETCSARGSWATDVEWGRGDVSRTYDIISVLKADGFAGPMLVEHESGSSDPDVREREILTAVRAIRGEPAPVAAGLGEVLGPYLTALAATNAARGAEFTPSAEVAAALGTDDARATYCNMFEFDVVLTAGGKWAVAAFLKPQDWTNVVESAQAATRQIPVAKLAAQEYGTPLENVPLTNCVPGFYYSLYDGSAVTNVSVDLNEDNRDILCGPGKTVTIPVLPQPSSASGFFAIGVLEIPMVYVPGEDHVITGLHFEIPKPRRR